MSKNAQTTTQLYSSHTLVKECSKFSKPDVNKQYMICEFPDVQAEFRKGRGTRNQITNTDCIIEKAREFQKKTSALLTTLKPSTLWISKTVENSQRDGNKDCFSRK